MALIWAFLTSKEAEAASANKAKQNGPTYIRLRTLKPSLEKEKENDLENMESSDCAVISFSMKKVEILSNSLFLR